MSIATCAYRNDILFFVHREITSNQRFADSKWHLVLFVWGVKNGILRLHVDDKVVYSGQSTQYSVPFPGGNLILGQSQDISGAIIKNEALKAAIMHFNMWEHVISEEMATGVYSDCNVQIGNLVPWSEMQIAIHGAVTRTAFVRCLPKGMTVLFKRFEMGTLCTSVRRICHVFLKTTTCESNY